MPFDEDGILNPRFPQGFFSRKRNVLKTSSVCQKRKHTGSSLPWEMPPMPEGPGAQPARVKESHCSSRFHASKDGQHRTVSLPPSEPKFNWNFPNLTVLHWLGFSLAASSKGPNYNGWNKSQASRSLEPAVEGCFNGSRPLDSPSLHMACVSWSQDKCNTSWHHVPPPGRKKGEEQMAFYLDGFIST